MGMIGIILVNKMRYLTIAQAKFEDIENLNILINMKYICKFLERE
jgi:hypothetical protein